MTIATSASDLLAGRLRATRVRHAPAPSAAKPRPRKKSLASSFFSLRRKPRGPGVKRTRILFLTHYFPPEGNAPASRVHEMCKRWVRDGHEVTVITCAPNN